jgi:hypothetical protein
MAGETPDGVHQGLAMMGPGAAQESAVDIEQD